MKTLFKLAWVECKLFIREPISLVLTLALPLLFLFVMGGVFGNTPNPTVYRGVGPMNYYLPAYIGLVLASLGVVTLPVHLTGYRERGVLRRLRASSISAGTVFGSQLLVSFVIAIVGAILLTIVALPIYDVQLAKDPLQFSLAFLLSTLCFAALGMMIGTLLATTRAAQGLGLILFFVMMMLSGAGPPREVITDAMRLLADLTPLRYVILVLQDPWLGFGWNSEASLVVAGITALAAIISIRRFKWQ